MTRGPPMVFPHEGSPHDPLFLGVNIVTVPSNRRIVKRYEITMKSQMPHGNPQKKSNPIKSLRITRF